MRRKQSLAAGRRVAGRRGVGHALPRPASDTTLNGSAPDTAPVALLLIDVINSFAFPEGATLLEQFLPAARRIAALKREARQLRIPTVYVNDNFGRWRSDFHALVQHCLKPRARGAQVAKLLLPKRTDYFVLKPKHSGFFCTTLELLLEHLGAHTLILAGVATNVCVLSTATDAYMRDFELVIPRDCVAALSRDESDWALQHMQTALAATIVRSESLKLPALIQEAARKTRLRHA